MSDARYGFGGVGVGDQGVAVGLWFRPERVEVGRDALVRLSVEELWTLRSLIDAALEEGPAARAITFAAGQEEAFESNLRQMAAQCVRIEQLDGAVGSVVVLGRSDNGDAVCVVGNESSTRRAPRRT